MFCKLDNGSVLVAENFVLNKDYELRDENYTTYTYPVDGWSRFETLEDAYAFFGVEMPKPEAPMGDL